jgi:hypothetical protein
MPLDRIQGTDLCTKSLSIPPVIYPSPAFERWLSLEYNLTSMDGLTFIPTIITVLIPWPVALLMIVLIFKEPNQTRMPKLKNLTWKKVTVEFQEGMADVTKELNRCFLAQTKSIVRTPSKTNWLCQFVDLRTLIVHITARS